MLLLVDLDCAATSEVGNGGKECAIPPAREKRPVIGIEIRHRIIW
jgi:hypothetical protein